MKYSKWILLALCIGAFMPVTVSGQSAMFPQLGGGYPVSRAVYHLTDNVREEIFTDDPDDARELLVTFYYPTTPEPSATPAFYVDGVFQQEVGATLGVEPVKLNSVYSQAFENQPVMGDNEIFPVLIFSPGMGTLPLFYTSLMENIASYGYIVATISHPYSAAVTVFPDERVIYANATGTVPGSTLGRETVATIWANDMAFVLDEIELLNDSDPLLGGRFDLERVGAFGHAFGGATAAEAVLNDRRFIAGLDMDGALSGDVAEQGVRQPFMFLLSADNDVASENGEAVFENSSAAFSVQIAGTMPETFATDLPLSMVLFPDVITTDMVGEILPERAFEVISAYTLAFFDEYVKGRDVILLDGASADFPEATFESNAD